MNMATVVAVYAALCKEMGLPFRFPGSTTAYCTVMEMTDAELLAKAVVGQEKMIGVMGRPLTSLTGTSIVGRISGPKLAEFFQNGVRSTAAPPLAPFMSTRNLSGRRWLETSSSRLLVPGRRSLAVRRSDF